VVGSIHPSKKRPVLSINSNSSNAMILRKGLKMYSSPIIKDELLVQIRVYRKGGK
jgi:hypothetical protein